VLAGADAERIAAAARAMFGRAGGWPNPFGDGHAAERILDALLTS
jgi:UDP-N-acetylglucosamine 2-epimerase (non-hydrolysing)